MSRRDDDEPATFEPKQGRNRRIVAGKGVSATNVGSAKRKSSGGHAASWKRRYRSHRRLH